MKRKISYFGFFSVFCILTAILLTVSMSAAETLGGISFTQDTPLEVSKVYDDMPMTIDVTVKMENGDPGYYSILGNYEATTKTSLVFSVNNGKPYLYYNFGDGNKVSRVQFGNIKINTGEPTRVTVVYDSTAKTITCYINGESKQVLKSTDNPLSNSKAPLQTNYEAYGDIVFVDSFYFGGDRRSGNTSYFKNGTIYSAALYGDVRTAQEIAAAQIDTADESLIAAYDFTAGSNVLKDLSSNGYDLIAHGAEPELTGMTFSKDAVYTAVKPFDRMPNTFDALIMLPVSSSGQNAIIGNYENTAHPTIQLEIRAGSPYLYYNAGDNQNVRFNFSGVKVNTGEPVRVTVVRDAEAGTISCYVNGTLKQTLNASALKTILDNNNITEIICDRPHALGSDRRSGNSQAFTEGVMYSLALYSDALTTEEIAKGQLNLNDENLIAAYDLTGTPVSMADISGNGYNVGLDRVVSFKGNGAFGVMTDVDVKTGVYTLPKCSFVPPVGKTFAGWALTPDGKAIEDTTYNVTDNVTLYALWTDMTMPEGGLTFTPEPYYCTQGKLSALPYTYSAWVCVPKDITGSAGTLLGNRKNDAAASMGFEICENGNPGFYFRTAAGDENYYDVVFDNVNVNTGEWTLVTLVIDETDGKTVTCYINGESCGSKTLNLKIPNGVLGSSIFLGGTSSEMSGGSVSNFANGSYFRGAMKEMLLYQNALGADEVAALYQNGAVAVDKKPVAHYVLSADDHGKIIADESGNNNTLITDNRWVQMDDVTGYEYSFAIVGDTQIISRDYPEKLSTIYNWIVDNKDEKKIQYVIGLGDITDDDTEEEWTAAEDAISIMDGKIPYSIIRGNHDSAAKFNRYFAKDPYMSTLEGFFIEGDATSSYNIFTAGDDKYLILSLDYMSTNAQVAWATDVVEAHPDCKVIVSIHSYICNCTGKSVLLETDGPCIHRIRNLEVDSKELWETFVSQHENIIMVLCGHSLGNDIVVLRDEGVNGNTVTQMFSNPQTIDATIRPTGMVTMMYFYPDSNEVTVEYYSTINDSYYKESNRFTMSLGKESEDESEEEIIAKLNRDFGGSSVPTERLDSRYLNVYDRMSSTDGLKVDFSKLDLDDAASYTLYFNIRSSADFSDISKAHDSSECLWGKGGHNTSTVSTKSTIRIMPKINGKDITSNYTAGWSVAGNTGIIFTGAQIKAITSFVGGGDTASTGPYDIDNIMIKDDAGNVVWSEDFENAEPGKLEDGWSITSTGTAGTATLSMQKNKGVKFEIVDPDIYYTVNETDGTVSYTGEDIVLTPGVYSVNGAFRIGSYTASAAEIKGHPAAANGPYTVHDAVNGGIADNNRISLYAEVTVGDNTYSGSENAVDVTAGWAEYSFEFKVTEETALTDIEFIAAHKVDGQKVDIDYKNITISKRSADVPVELPELTVYIEAPETVKAGESFTADIFAVAGAEQELAAVNFSIICDASLTVTSIVKADGVSGEYAVNGVAYGWAYDSDEGGIMLPKGEPVKIATATFKVSDTAAAGTVQIGIDTNENVLLNAAFALGDDMTGFTPDVKGDETTVLVGSAFEIEFIDAEEYRALAADQQIAVIFTDEGDKGGKLYTITYGEGDSEVMYRSERYGAYVAIVDATYDEATLAALITVTDGEAPVVSYNGDVNGDGRLTAGDAALISELLHCYTSDSKASDTPWFTDIIRLSADVSESENSYVTVADAMVALCRSVGIE